GQRAVIGLNGFDSYNQLIVLPLGNISVSLKAGNDSLQLVNRSHLLLDRTPQDLNLYSFVVHLVTDFKGVNRHHSCIRPSYNERPTSTYRPRLLHQPEIPCQSHREEP